MVVGVAALASYLWWPPDVLLRREVLVVERGTTDGHTFAVTQRWGSDFYATLLTHRGPDGTEDVYVLDGDDRKRWSGQRIVDEGADRVTVFLSGEQVATFDWKEGVFRRRGERVQHL